ncbi:MAG: hypothetical protein Q4E74_01845 [Ruminococcus sp.]|nr:hypothetical protein [Ruminococcus sp.]
MTKLIQILAEDGESGVFSGALHGWQGVIGIIMAVTGLLIIYFGIKVFRGYKFLPEHEQNIPKEDNFLPVKAKVLQKKKTRMPSFNGGEATEFVEWKIGYEIDGEKYTQMIPDDGYEKGQFLDIKYNPDAPEEYYLDNGSAAFETESEEKTEENDRNSMGILFAGIGLLIGVIGVMLAI